MPGMFRIALLTRPPFAGGTARGIRHGGGDNKASVQVSVRVVNSTMAASNNALPSLLLNGSLVVSQPAPNWVTGCSKAFPLRKDHRKKADNLGRLDSVKEAQQLMA